MLKDRTCRRLMPHMLHGYTAQRVLTRSDLSCRACAYGMFSTCSCLAAASTPSCCAATLDSLLLMVSSCRHGKACSMASSCPFHCGTNVSAGVVAFVVSVASPPHHAWQTSLALLRSAGESHCATSCMDKVQHGHVAVRMPQHSVLLQLPA